MNKRQKKKQYKKITGQNPPMRLLYSGMGYHVMIGKPWGGLARLKKWRATKAAEGFNRDIQNRNAQIREARRYTR